MPPLSKLEIFLFWIVGIVITILSGAVAFYASRSSDAVDELGDAQRRRRGAADRQNRTCRSVADAARVGGHLGALGLHRVAMKGPAVATVGPKPASFDVDGTAHSKRSRPAAAGGGAVWRASRMVPGATSPHPDPVKCDRSPVAAQLLVIRSGELAPDLGKSEPIRSVVRVGGGGRPRPTSFNHRMKIR
jgi:hypothetical protein